MASSIEEFVLRKWKLLVIGGSLHASEHDFASARVKKHLRWLHVVFISLRSFCYVKLFIVLKLWFQPFLLHLESTYLLLLSNNPYFFWRFRPKLVLAPVNNQQQILSWFCRLCALVGSLITLYSTFSTNSLRWVYRQSLYFMVYLVSLLVKWPLCNPVASFR